MPEPGPELVRLSVVWALIRHAFSQGVPRLINQYLTPHLLHPSFTLPKLRLRFLVQIS
jgi:hypothetical protein